MTVRELIAELQKVGEQDVPIVVDYMDDYDHALTLDIYDIRIGDGDRSNKLVIWAD